jgi:hypothetical protein
MCVCKYFSLCVVFVCVFVNIFVKKKKNLLYTMHSSIPCTFERRHGPAFELTFICSSAEPTSHTHFAEMRSYMRSIAYVFSPHVTFF